MCENCFDKEYYGFSSKSEFEKFEKILDLKCSTEKVQILESKNEGERKIMDFKMYYKCNTCNEKYAMSIPDIAWRGYFLKEQNAVTYHSKLKALDKKKKYGCLVILILIVLIAVYFIIIAPMVTST